jgi:hypothetical protein
MGELYAATIKREERIKSLGYNLITIWEKDWNDQKKNKKINEHLTVIECQEKE